MTKRLTEANLASELELIPDLSREQLVEEWKKIYGRPPPKGFGRRILELSAGYHLQVAMYGGLKPAVVKRLKAYAESDTEKGGSKQAPVKQRTLSEGSRLVREWHGNTYVVDVLETGFLFDGQTYKSLSKVAKEITGAHWSGRRFFGL
jgi:hypothetical protein